MRIPSPAMTNSWFPDLAVDSQGRVHTVWCETGDFAWQDPNNPNRGESVYYSVWDGEYWLPPNDIVPPQQDIIRNAIATDEHHTLHLLFDHSPPFGLYYKRASVDEAVSAGAWTPPRLVNGSRHTYMSDIAVSDGAIHIVYDDRGAESEDVECPRCADIFYRHSTDGGLTWSTPVNLYPSDAGSSRAQMEVDRAGTIHVAWDEGWDRLSGVGAPRYGVYVHSVDGGGTWSDPTIVSWPVSTLTATSSASPTLESATMSPLPVNSTDTPSPSPSPEPTVTAGPLSGPTPTIVPRTPSGQSVASYPDSTNAQLSVGGDGQGGVMLAWRTRSTAYPGIYYTWSTDHGESWSSPAALPAIVARRWGSPFDLYDMAADSAGHIHLLVVGHLSETEVAPEPNAGPPGLYHFEWTGDAWTAPSPVYEGNWYPEYPHLVVHAGNQLHATWFTREDPWEAAEPHQVWYAHGQSGSPHQPPVVRPTSTPTPESPLSEPTIDATAAASSPSVDPTLPLTDAGLPDNVYTESDEVFRLMIALLPVASLIIVVIVFKRRWLGKSG